MAKSHLRYKVNRAASKGYARKLQSYLDRQVWDSSTRRRWADFKCCDKDECKASAAKRGASFYAAQGHAVGDCYDLRTAANVPFRVLVVPMEAGGGKTYFDVEGRTEKVRESGRLMFRERNAHMKGVTLALRLAFDLPFAHPSGAPLVDQETERIAFDDGKNAHLFDCFAMANLLICSAVLKDSQKSLATAVMRDNCIRHLLETVDILRPTLVISQGWGGLKEALQDGFTVKRRFRDDLGDCFLAECDLDGHRFVWVALWHPTRFWSTINRTYFRETVVPAIQSGRRRALAVARVEGTA